MIVGLSTMCYKIVKNFNIVDKRFYVILIVLQIKRKNRIYLQSGKIRYSFGKNAVITRDKLLIVINLKTFYGGVKGF